ncbi:MAG TPA: radical SAM/SPASM domain-containing protein [Planctomycetota bacterium]
MGRKYYDPEQRQTVVEHVRNRLFRKPVPKFPRTIVIETQFGCNGSCVFCQYPQIKDQLPRGKMTMELFEKIARDCSGQNVERFILCLDNEPLLDQKLAERYALLRRHCPKAIRNLTTNASLLTLEKVEQLISSGLINELFLSVNGESKEVYEELMGLPYEKVMANLETLCKWLTAHPAIRKNLRVRVNTVKTQRVAPEIPAMTRRWEAEGFEMHVIDMDSRGDQLDLQKLSAEELKPNVRCRRPFHTMVITWEGDAVICCVDYKREVKLGNVQKHSLTEVWNSERAIKLRQEHLSGDFGNLPPCAQCKVNG